MQLLCSKYSLVIAGNRCTQMILPLFHISGCNVSPNGCAEHPHILFHKVMKKLIADHNANLMEGRNGHSNSLIPVWGNPQCGAERPLPFHIHHSLITRCNMIPRGMLDMRSHFTSINKSITKCKAIQSAMLNRHSHFRPPWRHCIWCCTMMLLTAWFSLGEAATAQWGTSTSDSLPQTLVVRFQMEIRLAHVHTGTIWLNTFKYPGKYPNL